MLELILQLFGGRGSGSGNKGGSGGGGASHFGGVKPSGDGNKFTAGDLVASGKTYRADDQDLYDRGDATVREIVNRVYDRYPNAEAIKFLGVDKATGDVTIAIRTSDGKAVKKVFRGNK